MQKTTSRMWKCAIDHFYVLPLVKDFGFGGGKGDFCFGYNPFAILCPVCGLYAVIAVNFVPASAVMATRRTNRNQHGWLPFPDKIMVQKNKISWIVSDLPLFAQITWHLLLNTAILTSDDFVCQSLSLTEIFTTWFSCSQCVHSSMVCYSPPTWSAFQWWFPDA